ncbi:MAG: hypothetical protein ACK5V4_06985, partial [Alphaproteobacteria bacterium]
MHSDGKGKNGEKKRQNKRLSSDAAEKFLKVKRAERYKELDSLTIKGSYDAEEQLALHIRESGISDASEFVDAGKKTSGIAQGKVVQRKGEDQRYMHKPSPKKLGNNIMNSEAETYFWDNIRELMAGDMFSLLLYN